MVGGLRFLKLERKFVDVDLSMFSPGNDVFMFIVLRLCHSSLGERLNKSQLVG